ncbi:EF-hand domain-containing protein [Luteibacter sp. PPL201]|uniref:EF-hand domain-containing protein n=1 Tax=Luteibacter sahnii TaxID=3021977 RepID=A0ABT6BFB3_9GAMM|nr:EF-hand domain-containing protein [Luteibacter sp. PPL193]MDY1549114.1 EF-hand domain-containing protein [Luteibacter sp. PPL193]
MNGRPYALALLLVATPAPAQDPPRTPADYLARFDTNGDGRVDEAEYVRYMSLGFQRMDVNGDGVIDANDRPMRPGQRPITLERFQHDLIVQFHRLDTNHDGYLSAKELTQPPR